MKQQSKYVVREATEYGCKIHEVVNTQNGNRSNYFADDESAKEFAERQNNVFNGEDTGRYVSLDKDSYWFPVSPNSPILENTRNLSMTTDYGLKFNTVIEINNTWGAYDKTIAKTHLSQWGLIAIDSNGIPIDNQYDYEGITRSLSKYMNSFFNTPRKITEIQIFSLKEGGMGISCKINGIKCPYKKLTKDDINAFGEHTDRYQLAEKYFSPLHENKQLAVSFQEIQTSGSKSLLCDVSQSSEKGGISNFYILDKYTGKTEPLNVGNIDLNKQSPESIKKLLSGKKVEMTNKAGINSLVGLNKTVAGWGISTAKQIFNSTETSADI